MIELYLQVVGLLLLFIGNLFITEAVTKWSAKKTKQWKIGNLTQVAGFIISLSAIFISTLKPNIFFNFEKVIDFDFSDLIAVLALMVSVIVAIYSWSKSRVIYDIKRMKCAHKPGERGTDKEKTYDEELRKLLNTGKWTILYHYDLSPITNEHCN